MEKTPRDVYAKLAKTTAETARQITMPLPGEKWKYPEWYFKFLRGECPLAITPDSSLIKLLEILSTPIGWHILCRCLGIDRGVINVCLEMGLVFAKDLSLISMVVDCNHYLGIFYISTAGEKVLKENSFII